MKFLATLQPLFINGISASQLWIFATVFVVVHYFILRSLQRFRQQFSPKSAFATELFRGLHLKICFLWVALLFWLATKLFTLKLFIPFAKAVVSFLFCLTLGDAFLFLILACFRKWLKDVTKLFPLLRKLTLFLCVIIGILMAANNLGYSINGLLTTFGIGGAAAALASQKTLANLWAALSILLDQPFKEGDQIIIGTRAQGTVEAIGLRSTRIRTDQDTIIIIPNNVISEEYIENKGAKNISSEKNIS